MDIIGGALLREWGEGVLWFGGHNFIWGNNMKDFYSFHRSQYPGKFYTVLTNITAVVELHFSDPVWGVFWDVAHSDTYSDE